MASRRPDTAPTHPLVGNKVLQKFREPIGDRILWRIADQWRIVGPKGALLAKMASTVRIALQGGPDANLSNSRFIDVGKIDCAIASLDGSVEKANRPRRPPARPGEKEQNVPGFALRSSTPNPAHFWSG